MQKAHIDLENEIACISLNPPSNQPESTAEPASGAMDCDEGSKLDSLVAVGMWTDMTVSSATHVGLFVMKRTIVGLRDVGGRTHCSKSGVPFWAEYV